MEVAPDLDSFLDAPIGRYVTEARWIYFYPTRHFSGFTLWGRLDDAAIEGTTKISPRVHARAEQPHVAIIDARRVESAHESAFKIAASYVRDHHAAIEERISQLAVVHGGGLLGAVAAGFFHVVRAPYRTAMFDDALPALQWLGLPRPEETLAELDRIYDETTGVSPLLRELRLHLERNIRDAALLTAARALGHSERSLQRKLGELGTTFQRELLAVRVRVTQRLLEQSDASLSAIAFDVGASSVQHLGMTFKKLTGETPSAWRARRLAQMRAPSS